MTDELDNSAAPRDVQALLQRIDDAWRELLAALDGIPEDRLTEPGVAGDWSIKDLFGHLAFWDEHAIEEVERALAGQPRRENDWQAMNDADYAARRGDTLPEARAAMHRAHAALLARLEGLAGLEAGRIDANIRADTYGHYEEHLPDIRSWRQRAGV